jgi:hypothetical protein
MTRIPVLDRLGDALEQAIIRDQATAGRRLQARRRAWRLAGVTTALGLGLAVILGVGPEMGAEPDGQVARPIGPLRVDPASAEVKVTRTNRYYKVSIGNVLADPETVRQALRQRGLDVTIRFLPASPSIVGTVVASYFEDDTDRDKVRWTYRPGRSVEGDVLAIEIPLDYRGRMGVDLARRARPGERYSSTAPSAQLRGEALTCADVEGRRVRDVLSVIGQRGVAATWRDPDNRTVPVSEVVDYYVAQTVPVAPGEVLVFTATSPPDPKQLASLRPTNAQQGCPAQG